MLSLENTTLYFIIAFGIGIAWYRLLFFIVPLYFKRPFTRSALKLRWHHLHWGIEGRTDLVVIRPAENLPIHWRKSDREAIKATVEIGKETAKKVLTERKIVA